MTARMPPWIPNAISSLRIALVPVWVVLAISLRVDVLQGHQPNRWWLAVVLASLGLSDVVDGFIARAFKLTSNLGATLDAVADKLAQVVLVTYLAWLPEGFTPVPRWLWAVLVFRDGALGVGWLVVYFKHRVVQVEHRWHGKVSSLVLFGVLFAATLGADAAIVLAGSLVSAVLIAPGTAAYLREGWRQLHC